LEESNIQVMEKLIRKAANTWLEFGMQRCRIVVAMEGSNLKLMEEKVQRVKDGALRLVVVPELKRIGNSKGQDLNVEETIRGYEGEIVEVSTR
jgi:hypothetical protein